MLLSTVACTAKPADDCAVSDSDANQYKYMRYASMSPEEIVAEMTTEQKASQMVQPGVYLINEDDMREKDYGSILSQKGFIDAPSWRELVDGFQQAAVESEAGIPYIYGQDDVHGVGYCLNGVYFPHNIGQGAANDEELAYQVGLITADEAKLCHMLWNFSPCVAQSTDPRWGRTYETYSADLETITKLSTAYTRGLIDGGLVACAKHFFGDGNVVYGTGEQSDYPRIIDRGDAILSEEEIAELLKVYQAQIDAGVQTIMISHSALNGLKMHENTEYIMMLKEEMGFEGFIVSDWDSLWNISAPTYREQIITGVNAGIDMLMEVERFDEARDIIIEAVGSGEISEERINDAVRRIIKVKQEAGIFDDPFCENIQTVQEETGSAEYRAVAEKLVEKSLVLLKNENDLLPLREGTKVYITGPAADDARTQCGGWTGDWNSSPSKKIPGVTTILRAFEKYADDYGIEVITDPAEAKKADVVLMCVGEQSYAEWNGDTEDLELCGMCGLEGNAEAIKEAKALGKPTVTCIVAGRHVILDPKDYKNWDSVVMCYLPGSEGKGISDVLCGCSDFTGRLPSPWYGSVEEIGTEQCVFEMGYGMSYPEGFVPRAEPAAVYDEPTAPGTPEAAIGTAYKKGVVDGNVYTNEYASITCRLPEGYKMADEYFLQTISEQDMEAAGNIEKDRLRESAKIFDGYVQGSAMGEFVSFEFINTKLGVPNAKDYTPDDYIDDKNAMIERINNPFGTEFSYGEREKVIICGEEYTKEVIFATNSGMEMHGYTYARRLDDDFIFVIDIIASQDMYDEDYESWFVE
ncbi:MAG: glycoside hydrolase family 3 protein [Ruminococcaceae bacterium]|nr:glycoside hydrolase family 3 protein [Oscillospiraceae bacterium]